MQQGFTALRDRLGEIRNSSRQRTVLSSETLEDLKMTNTQLPSEIIDLTVDSTGHEEVAMLENAFSRSDASSHQIEKREIEVNIRSQPTSGFTTYLNCIQYRK